jgi:hypothetical protein
MSCIFIDANIYLRFFDSNQKEFKKLLEELEKIKTSIFVTRQLVSEINRNKLDVFANSIVNYIADVKIKKVIIPEHFHQEHHIIDVLEWNKNRIELYNTNLKLIDNLDLFFDENLKEISRSSDAVSQKLKSIFLNALDPDQDIITLSKIRKELGNPPGKKNDPLGDQISWEQFKNNVKDKRIKEVWVVSNDTDFFTTHNKKIYLNPFLMDELLSINDSIKVNLFQSLADGLKDYSQKNPDASLISIDELELIGLEEKNFIKANVSSSNIKSIGYDEDSQTLEIEFSNGGIYQYFDVPQYMYEGLMSANSHGQYFAQNIKGVYRYSKI